MSLTSVDLPAPVWPTRATVSPGSTVRLIPFSALASLAVYPKSTSRSSIRPRSRPGMTGRAAGGVEVPSRSRSVIRRNPTMACW